MEFRNSGYFPCWTGPRRAPGIRGHFKNFFLLLALVFLIASFPRAAHAVVGSSEQITVSRLGILAFRPKPETIARWQPLVDYLNQTGLPRKIELAVYSYPELEEAVKQKRVDIVLTQPAHYTVLARRESLNSPLATLLEIEGGQVLSTFGGVILARSDRDDINQLGDLLGLTIATSSKSSLGAYQAQAMELLAEGIRLPNSAHVLELGPQQDEVFGALIDGRADVAFMRSGLLESMVREGKVDASEFKVIRAKGVPEYPLALSTRLYPQWALAAMPWADQEFARRVASAALALPHDAPAARAARIQGFAAPGNYKSVEDTMRALRVPPFDQPDFHFVDVWDRYRVPMAFMVAFVGVVSFLFFRLLATRQKLSSARDSLEEAQKLAQIGNWELDLRTRRLHWSAEIFRIFEIDPACFGATYEAFLAVVHPDDRDMVNEMYLRSLRDRRPYSIEHRLLFPDGRIKYVMEECHTTFDDNGKALRSMGTVQDITRRKEAEAKFRNLFESNQSVMLLIDPKDGAILDANPAAAKFYGYARDELVAMNIGTINTLPAEEVLRRRRLAEAHEQNVFEMPHRLKSGEVRTVEVRASPIETSDGTILFSIVIDVTERKRMEDQIRQLAFYDPLTSLPNRRLLIERLKLAMGRTKRSGHHAAIMFIDLDNFKPINDHFGHATGDEVLIEVARRLRLCVREVDTVSRLGGDEFVILVDDLSEDYQQSLELTREIAEKALLALGEPYHLRVKSAEAADITVSHQCTASIGVVVLKGRDVSEDDLLAQADAAMYASKMAGRNSIRFFDPVVPVPLATS